MNLGQLVADLWAISKPRIITLLLVVGWAGLFVGSAGFPDPVAFLAVTVAGISSTAASGALNNVIERDRDARMGRTADRPVASGRISVATAVGYAVVLAAISFLSLWLLGFELAAYLTLGAIAYYVIVYTIWLKPTTPQNIVIGGLAGSFPALIGWAAATGGLAAGAWIMAAIVFFWTPAHFWALALLYQEDYEAADYPMMPSVEGEDSTKRQMLAYAALTTVASLALVAVGLGGYLYLVAAAGLGVVLVARCARLLDVTERVAYRGFFLWTIQYLGILFLALMADQVVLAFVPEARPF